MAGPSVRAAFGGEARSAFCAWLALGPLVCLSCTTSPPSRAPTPSPASPASLPIPGAGAAAPVASPRVLFLPAPEGDLAPIVRDFVGRARAEGRAPVVYVGATWCEPCQYFHAAAERGELDGELPRLALLELDLDRDGARIRAAGYESRMIPLFAVPGEDGRSSGRQIEGSIHGSGSPLEIAPRLRALLGG